MPNEEGIKGKEDWFKTWFDTVYYHSLYKHRNEVEAKEFIHRLLSELAVPSASEVMDLACGKGRHSITLFEAGLRVTGLDLSENSINHLQEQVKPGLAFHQWDMREPYRHEAFDYIFNLFTSFGYFDDVQDNLNVLRAVQFGLRPGGVFVMDYLNAAPLLDEKSTHEDEVARDGFRFKTSKRIVDKQVVKSIEVEDQGTWHHFEERVQLFTLSELEAMIDEVGMELIGTYGSYFLEEYVETGSDRLILLVRKP
jgi:SAM-dependent methyltransferase